MVAPLTSLLLCPALPAVVRGGNDVRNRSLLAGLASLGRTGAVALRADVAPTAPSALAVAWWTTVGDPALTADALNRPGTGWMADPAGHPSDAWCTPAGVAGLRAVLAEVSPDVVVVSEASMWAYGRVCQDAGVATVLDLPALHGSMLGEIAGGDTATVGLVRRLLAERSALREGAAIAEADAVWVCSGIDEAVVRDGWPGAAVHLVPNTVEIPETVAPPPDDPLLLYPGLLSFAPNHRAALRLLDPILPAVRAAVPAAHLAVVGAGASPELVAAAAATEGAELVGPVDDTGPWFDRAAVVPVPLHEGGGTRVKILEALARGRPVVATPKAWEGLDLDAGTHVVEAGTDRAMADGIVALLQSPHEALALASAGRRAVADRYGPAALVEALRSALPTVHRAGDPAP